MAKSIFGTVLTRGKNYCGRYRKNGREYYTPTHPTKTGVRNDLAKIHAAILNGTWEDPTKPAAKATHVTLVLWADQWFALIEKGVKEGRYSPDTERTFISNWKTHVLPLLGPATPLADVTPEKIATMLTTLSEKRSRATVDVGFAFSMIFPANCSGRTAVRDWLFTTAMITPY